MLAVFTSTEIGKRTTRVCGNNRRWQSLQLLIVECHECCAVLAGHSGVDGIGTAEMVISSHLQECEALSRAGFGWIQGTDVYTSVNREHRPSAPDLIEDVPRSRIAWPPSADILRHSFVSLPSRRCGVIQRAHNHVCLNVRVSEFIRQLHSELPIRVDV